MIYTDGACSGNPGPGGWGAILMHGETRKGLSGGKSETTNNRMELQAAIEALNANDYTFCLLDVNLQGDLSAPVARYLAKAGIPFVFATGYGSDGYDMVETFDATIIPKPIEPAILKRALKDALGKAGHGEHSDP